LLRNLARRLEQQAPGVAASLLEGLDEMLTVARLKLPTPLRRLLACTNVIENIMGTVRRVWRNVKRWRNAAMALRWTAAGMLEATKGFRRLRAHKHLPVLRAALAAHRCKYVTQRVEQVVEAYRYVMQLRHKPAVLVLSRQPLPTLDRGKYAPASVLARCLCARRSVGRKARSDPHLVGQRGQPLCQRPRGAARAGHPLARGLDAVLGYFRASNASVPGQRAAARRERAHRGGAGLDLRLGTLRRRIGSRYGHENLRRVRPAQGAAAKIRVRARPPPHGPHAPPRQTQ